MKKAIVFVLSLTLGLSLYACSGTSEADASRIAESEAQVASLQEQGQTSAPAEEEKAAEDYEYEIKVLERKVEELETQIMQMNPTDEGRIELFNEEYDALDTFFIDEGIIIRCDAPSGNASMDANLIFKFAILNYNDFPIDYLCTKAIVNGVDITPEWRVGLEKNGSIYETMIFDKDTIVGAGLGRSLRSYDIEFDIVNKDTGESIYTEKPISEMTSTTTATVTIE